MCPRAQRLAHCARQPVRHVTTAVAGRGHHRRHQDGQDRLVRDQVAARGVRGDLPSQLGSATSARSRSPEEMCAAPVFCVNHLLCVPFPAPGGDTMMTRTIFNPRRLCLSSIACLSRQPPGV